MDYIRDPLHEGWPPNCGKSANIHQALTFLNATVNVLQIVIEAYM